MWYCLIRNWFQVPRWHWGTWGGGGTGWFAQHPALGPSTPHLALPCVGDLWFCSVNQPAEPPDYPSANHQLMVNPVIVSAWYLVHGSMNILTVPTEEIYRFSFF